MKTLRLAYCRVFNRVCIRKERVYEERCVIIYKYDMIVPTKYYKEN